MKKNIYCLGGACVDYKLKSIFNIESASSNPVTSYNSFGGVARNVAENLSNLTQHIFFQTVIGADLDGQALLSHLKNKNINVDACVVDPLLRTARYYAVLNPNGELYSAFADMEIYDQIPFSKFISPWESWVENSIIFLDTNLSTDIIQHAIKYSKIKNSLLCIDAVSIAKSKKIPQDLNGVYLIKADQYEASDLAGIKIINTVDVEKAGQILLARGVQQVLISLGKQGYAIINHDGKYFFPAISVDETKDVSGAGDAFFSGILVGLQVGMSLHEAARLGAAAASLTIQSYDTVLRSMTMEKIKELI